MKRHKNASYDPNEQPPTTNADFHGGVMSIPRSRGALSGVLLIIFGAWAALIPLIGPSFHYSYGTTKSWDFSAARWWLEILPGAVAVLAGLILIMTANRATAQFAAWIGAAAGAWLIIGRDVASWWHLGSPGVATSTRPFARALEALGMFSGIGALIVFTGALAVGRLSVRSVRDVRVAQKHERKAESRQRSVTEAAYQRGREDEAAERERAMANAGAGAGAGMAGAPGTEPQHHRGLHFGHSHADRVPEQTQQAQPGYPQATPDGGYPPAPPQQGYPQPEQPPRT